MKNRTNFTPETKALVTQLYLVEGLPPRDIEERLRLDLKVTITSDSLRQLIHRLGLPEKRKASDAIVTASLDPAKLAENRIQKATAKMEQWQTGAEMIVDRAMSAAENATGLRDLGLATSIAVQGVKLFTQTSGLDAAGRGPAVAVFDIHYASRPGSPFAEKNVTPADRGPAPVSDYIRGILDQSAARGTI